MRSFKLAILVAALVLCGCKGREAGLGSSVAPDTAGCKIDAHTHISPTAIEKALETMNDNGIAAMVNLSGNDAGLPFIETARAFAVHKDRFVLAVNMDWRWLLYPDKFGEVNAELMEEAAAFGAVAFKQAKGLGLYYPDPSKVNIKAEFDPTYGRVNIDWPALEKPEQFLPVDSPMLFALWKKLAEIGIPAYIHSADPKAFFEPATPKNERWAELSVHPDWSFADKKYYLFEELMSQLERVIAQNRATTFIAVHFGCDAEEPDKVAYMLAKYPNLYIDIAARVPEMGRHDSTKMRELFNKYSDRILFGTDFSVYMNKITLGSSDGKPKGKADAKAFYDANYAYLETDKRKMNSPTPIQGDWKIDAISLPAETLKKVYYKNAQKIIPSLAKIKTKCSEGGAK